MWIDLYGKQLCNLFSKMKNITLMYTHVFYLKQIQRSFSVGEYNCEYMILIRLRWIFVMVKTMMKRQYYAFDHILENRGWMLLFVCMCAKHWTIIFRLTIFIFMMLYYMTRWWYSMVSFILMMKWWSTTRSNYW